MATNIMKNTYSLFGLLELPDYRYTNYHIYNKSHQWETDLKKLPGFQNSFQFERSFVPIGNWLQLQTQLYWMYCIPISIIYVIVIFGLQFLMKDRQPFNLRKSLMLWNVLLAIFSIFGTYRCLPEFIHVLYHEGFHASYTKSNYYRDYRLSLWYLFFTLSKAFELIDTLFIVLRKSKLIPLHWIHHILTLNFSWFVFPDVPAAARWMVNMNFFVHSLMYTYYAFKALKFNIPKRISITITTLQIAQMFAGLYINYDCLRRKLLGYPVDSAYSVIFIGCLLYGLFAILFMNFFIKTYLIKTKPLQILTDINHNHYKGVVKKCQ